MSHYSPSPPSLQSPDPNMGTWLGYLFTLMTGSPAQSYDQLVQSSLLDSFSGREDCKLLPHAEWIPSHPSSSGVQKWDSHPQDPRSIPAVHQSNSLLRTEGSWTPPARCSNPKDYDIKNRFELLLIAWYKTAFLKFYPFVGWRWIETKQVPT